MLTCSNSLFPVACDQILAVLIGWLSGTTLPDFPQWQYRQWLPMAVFSLSGDVGLLEVATSSLLWVVAGWPAPAVNAALEVVARRGRRKDKARRGTDAQLVLGGSW
jgi:hypothetical protein